MTPFIVRMRVAYRLGPWAILRRDVLYGIPRTVAAKARQCVQFDRKCARIARARG